MAGTNYDNGIKVGNDIYHLSGLGAPSDGTSGTGAGDAGPGSIYYDATNDTAYKNTGTKASPVWVPISATHLVKSGVINIDNGAGTTLDEVVLRSSKAITLKAARVVYTTATTGTVAAATVQLGTTVAGVDIVAATALENTKAVGTVTALTLAAAALAANTPLIIRHTGIAATAAGEYYVELEYVLID